MSKSNRALSFLWVVVGLAALGVLGFTAFVQYDMWSRKREAQLRHEQVMQTKPVAPTDPRELWERRSWPLQPPKQLPPVGTRPVIPPPPPNRMTIPDDLSVDVMKRRLDLQTAARERAFYLVVNHPHPAINTDLRSLLDNQEVGFRYQAVAGLRAFFFLNETDSWSPYIGLGTDHLLRMATVEDAMRNMLSLYHENIHREQWISRGLGANDFHFRETRKGDPVDPNWCQLSWQHEREAHWKTCQLAASWDFLEAKDTLCQRLADPADFDHALFVLSHNNAAEHAKEKRICIPAWAEFAGHPDPKAF
jgi:hypothetical protein